MVIYYDTSLQKPQFPVFSEILYSIEKSLNGEHQTINNVRCADIYSNDIIKCLDTDVKRIKLHINYFQLINFSK